MESISIREAAERLGVSHKVVRRLIAQDIVKAHKASGGHGVEWRVDVASLDACSSAPGRPAPSSTEKGDPPEAIPQPAPARPTLPAAGEVEGLRADKRFLQEQVQSLTTLLHAAMSGSPPSSAGSAPDSVADGQNGPLDASSVAAPASGSAPGLSAPRITEALQTSLSSLGLETIRSLEMCSLKVLWGKPVLWRVVADRPDDVAALLEAILSPDAAWDAPAGEVVFLWARDAAGEVVWGAPCGSEWFGAPFQDALRQANVQRR